MMVVEECDLPHLIDDLADRFRDIEPVFIAREGKIVAKLVAPDQPSQSAEKLISI